MEKTAPRIEIFPQTLSWGEVLWASSHPIGPENLTLKVVIDDAPNLPPDIIIPEISGNKQMLGLIAVTGTSENPVLTTKLTDYRNHVGTNLNQGNFEKIRATHPELLANGIVVCSLIFTSDNRLVLGNRMNGLPGVIGGTLNTDEKRPMTYSYHLFMHMEDEIQEELGWSENEFESASTRLLGIVLNGKKLRPLLVFVTSTSLTSDEINQIFNDRGNKEEHTGLIFLENTPQNLSQFLADHPNDASTTLATLDSLKLYGITHPIFL